VACIDTGQALFGERLRDGARESALKRRIFGRSVKEGDPFLNRWRLP
jgi:hypothetical protein